jgi:hypothetical protein
MELTAHGMLVVRVYNTDDGESHLDEVEYSLATTNHGLIGENVAVDDIVLRIWHDNPPEAHFHVAPRRQLVLHLSGSAEVVTSDGARRSLPTGSVLLTEDTEGKGHDVRGVDLPRLAMFVPLLTSRRQKAGLLW